MNRLLSLKTELDKSAYSGLGATAALAAVHAIVEQKTSGFMLTTTSAMREFGSTATNDLMTKFEDAAVDNAVLTRVLPLMRPSERGVNTSDPEFQVMMDVLAGDTPFSDTEATGLKALGFTPHYTFSWANVQDIIDARHL